MQTRANYNRFEMFVTQFLDHLVEKRNKECYRYRLALWFLLTMKNQHKQRIDKIYG